MGCQWGSSDGEWLDSWSSQLALFLFLVQAAYFVFLGQVAFILTSTSHSVLIGTRIMFGLKNKTGLPNNGTKPNLTKVVLYFREQCKLSFQLALYYSKCIAIFLFISCYWMGDNHQACWHFGQWVTFHNSFVPLKGRIQWVRNISYLSICSSCSLTMFASWENILPSSTIVDSILCIALARLLI